MESRCQYQRESYSIAHWKRNNIRKQYESYKAYWDGCPCVANSLASLSAQTTLSGMVRDESGKALGNVMVRAYNQHKKLKRYAQTNRQGEFRLATTAHDSISSITLHDEAIQAGTGE